MATEALLIELDGKAVDNLRALMKQFGESRPDDMISTAISVMDALKGFVHDGKVTVIDPNVPSDDPEEREVDLLFEKMSNGSSGHPA